MARPCDFLLFWGFVLSPPWVVFISCWACPQRMRSMASVLLANEERRFGLARPHKSLDDATSRSVEELTSTLILVPRIKHPQGASWRLNYRQHRKTKPPIPRGFYFVIRTTASLSDATSLSSLAPRPRSSALRSSRLVHVESSRAHGTSTKILVLILPAPNRHSRRHPVHLCDLALGVTLFDKPNDFVLKLRRSERKATFFFMVILLHLQSLRVTIGL